MPKTQTRNKNRKRVTQKRLVNSRGVRAAYRARANRSAKRLRRTEGRSRVPEMLEQRQKARTGRGTRSGEDYSVAISPTGTQQHQPQRRRLPRLARSRAKSPMVGRARSIVDSR